MTIKKDLQALNRDIKALNKTVDRLVKAIEKSEVEPSKKRAPGLTATTATDQVLRIINRSKKGVDTGTLMKKTGFSQKKIRNILNRTYKLGKIKRAAKGVYVGA